MEPAKRRTAPIGATYSRPPGGPEGEGGSVATAGWLIAAVTVSILLVVFVALALSG